MSQAFAVETTIDRPAIEVWATLTDWDHAHRWMTGIDGIRANGDTAPGTTLTFHARGKDRPAEIASLVPGRAVTVRSTQGGVTADYAYEVSPVDDATTRVTLVADCRTSGLWAALSPLVRRALRRTDGGQLDELKRLVESG
ncbi:MAG: SRPBCC family protein [Actinomycetota bacterium]|nr:SRPBCC family protein [Actinomycetota bacterium]